MTTVTELGLSVLAGGLTTLSPCVFPLLPLVLGGVLPSMLGWIKHRLGARPYLSR